MSACLSSCTGLANLRWSAAVVASRCCGTAGDLGEDGIPSLFIDAKRVIGEGGKSPILGDTIPSTVRTTSARVGAEVGVVADGKTFMMGDPRLSSVDATPSGWGVGRSIVEDGKP